MQHVRRNFYQSLYKMEILHNWTWEQKRSGNENGKKKGFTKKFIFKLKIVSLDFDFSKLSSEAQELQLRERQRLERLDKNKEVCYSNN